MTIAIPPQPAITAGYVVQAADMNNLAAQATFLLNKPYARIQDVSAGQTLTSGTPTAVGFGGVTNINVAGSGQIDNNGMCVTAPGANALVAQTPGWYRFRYNVQCLPSVAGVVASFWLLSTYGSNNPAYPGNSGSQWPSEVRYNGNNETGATGGGLWPYYLYAGDYIQIWANSSGAGHLTTTFANNGPSFMEMEFVSAT